MIQSIREIGPTVLDITLMAILLYVLIIAFKRTRAAFVLTGMFIVACAYLVIRQFNLVMMATVFEKFFTIILVILVVIFQEEIRHFFEEVAVWSLNRRLVRKKKIHITRDEVEMLVRTLMEFARERTGALIVVRGKNILKRHLQGEVALNGELSEPLLKSIFDPHSIGHDGAVIIDGRRVTHFSCHLPLSKNLNKIRDRGTRHAAALGLTEVSDALCIVVSEEKGTISVARNGDVHVVNNPERLTKIIETFYEEIHPKEEIKPWEDIFKRNTREKVYAVLLSIGLWFVLVHGSKVVYKSYVVPVSVAVLPAEWEIPEMNPKELDVTLRGPRSAFYLSIRDRIKVYLNIKMQTGTQRVRVYTNDFTIPKGLILDDYDPHYINITLDKKKPAEGSVKTTEKNGENGTRKGE
jgi:diadenylate cyclase